MFPFQAAMMGVGLATSIVGASKKSKATKQASAASAKQEALRRQAMEMEAARKQRQIIRQAYIARSESLARTAGQTGSSAEGSSGRAGAFGQIAGAASENSAYVAGQLKIGQGIFDAKAAEAKALQKMAEGDSISKIGGMFMSQAGPFGQIMGSTLFGKDQKFQPGMGASVGSMFAAEEGIGVIDGGVGTY